MYNLIYNTSDKDKKNNEIDNKIANKINNEIDKNKKKEEEIKLMIEMEKYRFNECHGGC
tara:strand:+ start:158 stop:334 length:177 start_codon:yes stop_codon:yes gene_type:complete